MKESIGMHRSQKLNMCIQNNKGFSEQDLSFQDITINFLEKVSCNILNNQIKRESKTK